MMTLTNIPIAWLPLAEAMVKATLVLAAGAAATFALRRASAALRHMVWTLALCGALAIPVLTLALPKVEIPVVTIATSDRSAVGHAAHAPTVIDSRSEINEQRSAAAEPRSARSDRRASIGEQRSANTGQRASISEQRAAAVDQRSPVSEQRSASTNEVLLAIWIAGLVLVLARVAAGTIAICWLTRRTQEITDAPWLPMARALAREMGITPRLRFRRTARASMPVAAGIFRPTLLMPADADSWPDTRLRIVLLHELAHVKRRDCLTHLVAQAACALHWFNPLAWMAARRARNERERACDDLVIASGTRGADYADELLEIARVMRGSRFAGLLTGASLAMAHHSQLEGRLIAILDPRVPRGGVSRARRAGVIATCCVVLATVGVVRPWAAEIKSVEVPTIWSDLAAARAAATPSGPAGPQTPAATPADPAPASPAPLAASKPLVPAPSAPPVGAPPATPATPESSVAPYPVPAPAPIPTPASAPPPTVPVTNPGDRDQSSDMFQALEGARAVLDELQQQRTDEHPDVLRARRRVADLERQIAQAPEQPSNPATADVKPAIAGGKAKPAKQPRNPPDPRAVAALTAALKDTDKEVRETAMHALVQMRDPAVFEPLVQALRDASAEVRQQAVFGLGQLRDRRASAPLAGMLKDENAEVRQQAVFALGQLRDSTAVPALSAALKDASPDVRQQAAFALGQLRDASAVDALASVVRDANPDVREQAVFALSQIRDKRAVPPLVSALKDEIPDVRQQAAFALGQIRDAAAVDALVVAIKDSDADVREQVASALGQIRDPRAIDALTTALKDASADVRRQAAFALGQLAR